MIRTVYGDKSVQIAEQEPTSRTVLVNDFDHQTRCFLKWPRMVFIYTAGDCRFYAFSTPNPIRSKTDVVSVVPMPNTYSNGQVCLGSPPPDVKAGILSYFQNPFKIGEVLSDLWTSESSWKWRHGDDLLSLPAIKYRLCDVPILSNYTLPDRFDDKDGDICDRAYYLWERAGRPLEPGPRFWIQAEIDILYGRVK